MNLAMENQTSFKAFCLLMVCVASAAGQAPPLTAPRRKHSNSDQASGTKALDKGLRHAMEEILNHHGGQAFVDPCASAPCLNAGKCIVTSYSALTFRCHCVSGYTGLKCERGLNECLSGSCVHGTCVDRIGSFTCRCDLGFTGALCDQDINECANSPCLNGGSCEQGMPGRFICHCPRGFRGMRCQTDIDECLALSPCQNGGVCRQEGPGQYSCSCLPGFSGPDCQHALSPCALNPCLHNGRCLHNHSSDAWQCRCAPGHAGVRCEQEVNPCLVQSPCGQGECQPLSGGRFRCQCPPDVTGSWCDTPINPCASQPCLHGGRCLNPSTGAYRCRCRPNFEGPNCQTPRPEVCDATSVTCQNGGSCLSSFGRPPSCHCTQGFTGPRCQHPADPCQSAPCSNNATCRRALGSRGFTCRCPRGFAGPTCRHIQAPTTPITTTTTASPTTTGSESQGSTTEKDGDHTRIRLRPIDPTLLFILLGTIGALTLVIGIAFLVIKLIGCQKPRDFCLALPWTPFRGQGPHVISAWTGPSTMSTQAKPGSMRPGLQQSPSLDSVYLSPKPLADYTFRRY